jgi:phosphoserine phosphatase RsbU/P
MEGLMESSRTHTAAIPGRILIADDQTDILEALRLLLKQEGYEIHAVTSREAILRALHAREFDLLMTDLNYSRDTTSGREGIDVVSRVREMDPRLPIIAMTAWGTIDLAVEAMHKGAGEFILKPWDDARLVEMVRSQIEQGRARREADGLDGGKVISSREMLEARDVQRGLLPNGIPQFPGFEISSAWRPARVVGGDYFDVFQLNRYQAALCIGDVSGKGLAGALLMSNLQAAVRATARVAPDPRSLCERLNELIRANIAADKFITFFYGLLDVSRRTLTYANAGHNAPVLVRADSSVLRLDQGGPVLGVFPEPRYARGNVHLAPGDRLVLFTDGLVEATNSFNDEFGEERLIKMLVERRSLAARPLLERAMKAASQFCNGHFEDDATLVVTAVESW